MIQTLVKQIPDELLSISRSVFYSGRNAFSAPSDLYVLGFNPDGDPVRQRSQTVSWHTEKVLNELPDAWSAYQDESWNVKPVGTYRMQPRVLHTFNAINRDPRCTPSSNLICVRSRGEDCVDDHIADTC
jgi:hypothetical protein